MIKVLLSILRALRFGLALWLLGFPWRLIAAGIADADHRVIAFAAAAAFVACAAFMLSDDR